MWVTAAVEDSSGDEKNLGRRLCRAAATATGLYVAAAAVCCCGGGRF